jgi:hypothetical protein
MSENDTRAAFGWITHSSLIAFTGILGTGSILGLKSTLVRDTLTLWLFWATVGSWGMAAVIAAFLKGRCYFSGQARLQGPAAVLMLLGLIGGLVGSGVLCTIRNW